MDALTGWMDRLLTRKTGDRYVSYEVFERSVDVLHRNLREAQALAKERADAAKTKTYFPPALPSPEPLDVLTLQKLNEARLQLARDTYDKIGAPHPGYFTLPGKPTAGRAHAPNTRYSVNHGERERVGWRSWSFEHDDARWMYYLTVYKPGRQVTVPLTSNLWEDEDYDLWEHVLSVADRMDRDQDAADDFQTVAPV